MNYKKHIVILFLLCSQFCFAQQNLIQNGGFEDSVGNPSLDGWYMYAMLTHFFLTPPMTYR